jgi:hypothetical protein
MAMEKYHFLTSLKEEDLQVTHKKRSHIPPSHLPVSGAVSGGVANQKKKPALVPDANDGELRKASTKNWNESQQEALPIKIHGKVVKKMKTIEKVQRKIDSDEEAEEGEGSDDENDENEDKDEDNEFEMPEKADFDNIGKERLSGEGDDIKRKDFVPKEISLEKKKLLIAEICHAITQDPMKAFRRRHTTHEERENAATAANAVSSSSSLSRHHSSEDKENDHRIIDIFSFLHDPDSRIQEIAMLSCYLLFKDICPGYKIRKQDESDTQIQHKKEIKRFRDFDLSILSNYNYFLKYLSKKVTLGLGSLKRTEPMYDHSPTLTPTLTPTATAGGHVTSPSSSPSSSVSVSWQLGVSALRIQCELLKSLSYFNYRSTLILSLVSRAGQPLNQLSKLCSQTLETILRNDSESEVTFEIIQTIGRQIHQMKYQVHENLLLVLQGAKLMVHSSMGKDIRKKVKQNKRKRQRDEEGVEANLQETDTSSQALVTKRYQADALHEICVIYFRYE